jgi:mRNA degradation ribonuclease J1/J2
MQKSISGSVAIKCKTDNCTGIFAGDFVFDLAEWKEKFTGRKLICKTCETTHDYSRNDIISTPAQILEETAKDGTS